MTRGNSLENGRPGTRMDGHSSRQDAANGDFGQLTYRISILRFIANGPSIPDELLLARDQGRVVFFCGSGISRAKAKLPDFFELAEAVIKALGVPADDPTMKIIAQAKVLGDLTGVDGLISADRIFGLLERDFLSRDIQKAVARALTTKGIPDLAAHHTLLRLATTLALLHAVLPDNVSAWPYGIDATIDRIGEADNELNSDERLIELKRKWDSR